MHQGFARGLSLTRLWFKDIRELCWGFVCTRDSHVVVFSQDLCTRELHESCVCTRALQMGVAWRLCLHEGCVCTRAKGSHTRLVLARGLCTGGPMCGSCTKIVFSQGLCLHKDFAQGPSVWVFCTWIVFSQGLWWLEGFAPGLLLHRGVAQSWRLHEGFARGCVCTRALHGVVFARGLSETGV